MRLRATLYSKATVTASTAVFLTAVSLTAVPFTSFNREVEVEIGELCHIGTHDSHVST